MSGHSKWSDIKREKKSVQEEKPDIKHNWLYSVIPASVNETNNEIYLVGYCKQDNKYFTVLLNRDYLANYVVLGDLNIPKWGCQPQD